MKSVFYKGYEFKMYKNEKYYSNFKLKKRLHQFVWEQEVGEIPKGYHIHHKDGDKTNNDISNLELVERIQHLTFHSNTIDKETLRRNMNEKARPKAIEWHKSEKGSEWHKKHFEKFRDRIFVPRNFVCLECGKEFSSTQTESKFCTAKCRSKNRRKSGVDDIEKVCPVCNSKFKTNKYTNSTTCSKSCSNRYRKIIKDSLNLQEKQL